MATQATTPLNGLPTEILQRVATLLPPQSALNFVLCSRRIHDACDQLSIWRQTVQLTSGFTTHPVLLAGAGRITWKRFAVADAKAHSLNYDTGLLHWLPQAMAYHHQVSSSADLGNLHLLSDPSHHAPGQVIFENEIPIAGDRPTREYPGDLTSLIDINAWYMAQAASFCYTATILCRSFFDHSPSGNPWAPAKSLLEACPWTKIRGIEPESQPAEYLKLAVVLHTLANKAIGLLGARLRAHLAKERTSSNWRSYRTSSPPLPRSIPFSSMMVLPNLFDSNSVREFSLCHIAKMATPGFFKDCQWTGYECIIGPTFEDGGLRYTWDGMGEDNIMIQLNNFDQPPHTNGNPKDKQVERNAKFTLSRWEDSRFYVLQSNYFHGGHETHRLTLRVDSLTGMIRIIRHVDFDGLPRPSGSGVITPFGIVFGGVCRGYWLWLWKVDWSSESRL
ncbi:hypothetical protein B0J14DRAFT_21822 [Halenospora varia]|nr:hypothetical protein B0J14DRAFT_21822 [Halenospora varia]